jgi:CBS domain containing-hemolysin-like protein
MNKQKISFEPSKDMTKTQIAVESIMVIILFSIITTTSLALNSLMQTAFSELIVKPKKKVLANAVWVVVNIVLIVVLLLTWFKDTRIKL